jgi:hypothetical protein
VGAFGEGLFDAMAFMLQEKNHMIPSDSKINRFISYKRYLQSNYSSGFLKKPVFLFFITSIIRLAGVIRSIYFQLKRKKQVDILFLMGCREDAIRVMPIVNILDDNGIETGVEIRASRLSGLKRLAFGFVPFKVPSELVLDYAEAAYYAGTYNASAIAMMENSCLYPSFLKELMVTKTVNIAHGVRVNAWEHSYIDFDYYLLFGESSIKHLQENRYLFGSTRALLTGSPFVDKRLASVTPTCNGGHIVYFSQYQNPLVKNDILFSHDLFKGFVDKHPEVKFVIKLHPLEDETYWVANTSHFDNVEIVAGVSNIHEVLSGAFCSIVAWSNCAVESAIAKCPVIAIDQSGYANKYLEISDYFPVVDSIDDLETASVEIKDSYQLYQVKCQEFAEYHMNHAENAQQIIAGTLTEILTAESPGARLITESYSW